MHAYATCVHACAVVCLTAHILCVLSTILWVGGIEMNQYFICYYGAGWTWLISLVVVVVVVSQWCICCLLVFLFRSKEKKITTCAQFKCIYKIVDILCICLIYFYFFLFNLVITSELVNTTWYNFFVVAFSIAVLRCALRLVGCFRFSKTKSTRVLYNNRP